MQSKSDEQMAKLKSELNINFKPEVNRHIQEVKILTKIHVEKINELKKETFRKKKTNNLVPVISKKEKRTMEFDAKYPKKRRV